jgi:hypothetical protein
MNVDGHQLTSWSQATIITTIMAGKWPGRDNVDEMDTTNKQNRNE